MRVYYFKIYLLKYIFDIAIQSNGDSNGGKKSSFKSMLRYYITNN